MRSSTTGSRSRAARLAKGVRVDIIPGCFPVTVLPTPHRGSGFRRALPGYLRDHERGGAEGQRMGILWTILVVVAVVAVVTWLLRGT
jgi:hypothetical protein